MVKQAVSDDSLIGKTLGHYCIAEKIGAGAMGEVYRARDEHLDREVAIKVLPSGILSDESSRRRFCKEALALSKLNHPNIATIHDFDTQQGVDFLVMEYIPGYVYFPCFSPDECIQGKIFMTPMPVLASRV